MADGYVHPAVLSLYTIESTAQYVIAGNEPFIWSGLLFDVDADYAVFGSVTLGVMIARRDVSLDDAFRALIVSETRFALDDPPDSDDLDRVEQATRRVLGSLFTYSEWAV